MNVLILTPDAVGSTLLQRMLTIYMQFHEFSRPVINLHELTNGLAKYYSPEFNQELVGKKTLRDWGYYQTLQEVVELLGSVDHYKTSRLAHYHICRRGDTIQQQIPFYDYLNKNFYIIACRRNNVFEHALSMTLNKTTKKLNVYTAQEKIDAFYEIYKSGIVLDTTVFVKQLEAYKLYINWSEQHFDVGSYFNYEQDIPRLEKYILDLPVFSNHLNRITWDQNFGISFNNWNKMHYVRSDINHLFLENSNELKKSILEYTGTIEHYQQHAPEDWPAVFSPNDLNNLPTDIKQQCTQNIIQKDGILFALDQDKQQLLAQYKQGYNLAQRTINQMIDLGIIINGPPIKKQTLGEKQKVIKNFDILIELYNQWAKNNPDIATSINEQDLATNNSRESEFWNSIFNTTDSQPVLLPTPQ